MQERKLLVVALVVLCACQRAGAEPDKDYDVTVEQPAFKEKGPVVLFDEAHHNIHKANWTYAPFARLIENDGFRLQRNHRAIDADALRGVDVVVIANALGNDERNQADAFTTRECEVLEQWVKAGGGLLLITDHYPTGHAVATLAARFGVDMSKGITEDSTRPEQGLDASHIVFTPDSGLAAHPITEGVSRVVTFTGQSLSVPRGAAALLALGPHAIDLAPAPRVVRENGDVRVFVAYGDTTSASGRAQAIALPFGAGRVVVTAEAAMLTAQLSRYDRSPFGMNVRGNDNRRLALNTMRWLAQKL